MILRNLGGGAAPREARRIPTSSRTSSSYQDTYLNDERRFHWSCSNCLLQAISYVDMQNCQFLADPQNVSARTEGVLENGVEWMALLTFSPRTTPAD
ncbi:hypothetical protein AB1N83_013886 [Pleurotus pulmonarius]